MTAATAAPRQARSGALREVGTGVAAVGVKELRGRMRGKRSFVIITINLLLIAGFAWMIESISERNLSGGFGAHRVLGLVRDRAPAVHRDHVPAHADHPDPRPGLDRGRDQPRAREADARPADHDADLVARDHPRQAAVSALSWILLLLAASIPIVALVFTFGGVAPDDVLRVVRDPARARRSCYGAIGLFVSALVKRTQAATVINLVAGHRADRRDRVHLPVLDRDDRQLRVPPRPARPATRTRSRR